MKRNENSSLQNRRLKNLLTLKSWLALQYRYTESDYTVNLHSAGRKWKEQQELISTLDSRTLRPPSTYWASNGPFLRRNSTELDVELTVELCRYKRAFSL